ncbi:MBL fold metallo-hydrolase RNA specificity domain-containing protein [Candidatus Nanohalobium constans]|uniref:mRNA cleavage and polyadenylation specificity factor-like protein n=1 Tax=Candidatus Nanohalobium constans TaxID=2565781 RepID=A0A5Q0UHX8_9ARCH|nr:MBL fold metallo-hydrolase [Candidatus Nanohalobium constans]QGA80535.1 mRNA cleavage and polyadenylation specificity factor-like protein [Candidatus Nanohalobium constans]
MKITEKDGIHIQGEEKVVADSRNSQGDINLVSHAHFDHMHLSDSEVVCSELTAKLAGARAGKEVKRTEHDRVELYNSGHILGSSAAKIKGEKSVLYTGDVSLRDRVYLDGFNPVSADILVVESTYGIPAYRFPEQRVIENRIKDFIQNEGSPLILFGYSLGKAQKIQKLAEQATERPILAHGSVKNMNDVVEESAEKEFRAIPYGENKELMEDNGILVAPSNTSQSDWVEKLVDKTGAVKAGFSGWATTDSFKYRGGYDETFQLSDHCDFDGLVKLVEEVDPEKVYVQHGFDEEFASYLKREKGFNARALKQNQSSLTDF